MSKCVCIMPRYVWAWVRLMGVTFGRQVPLKSLPSPFHRHVFTLPLFDPYTSSFSSFLKFLLLPACARVDLFHVAVLPNAQNVTRWESIRYFHHTMVELDWIQKAHGETASLLARSPRCVIVQISSVSLVVGPLKRSRQNLLG
jgi:hypothetical protein